MVPAPRLVRNAYPLAPRLLYTLLSLGTQQTPRVFRRGSSSNSSQCQYPLSSKCIAFATLIPVLVLLSGVFAGLTLGYMSLDETQLNVLSISGTPTQRAYANKIKPIRKNGHLLLVTLLLANMIVNETLPVIADPVLGGGVQSVVVSTVLIVIFAEIIPQSLCTRHGLYLGAKMAGVTQVLIYTMGIVAFPVAKILELVLGPHHGIIYRRAELKELIAMHSTHATHGGDLKTDTVTIIGATLDLQEKVVKQAMTPISDVFMLSIDSKLDYDLLKKICQTGHSRVPVYEEVDVPVSSLGGSKHDSNAKQRTEKMKKILGILLVKQCVLLDPEDATPLRQIPLNKVPFIPNNEPLLRMLDIFQEGRSHMAIVSRFSVEKAASVKHAVKRGLTQRLRQRVGMGDSDSSDEEKDNRRTMTDLEEATEDGEATLREDGTWEKDYASEKPIKAKSSRRGKKTGKDIEKGVVTDEANVTSDGKQGLRTSFDLLPKAAASMTSMYMLEQSMPADAVLTKEGANEFLQNFDPAVMPVGIITLEDVLEELIGEEIYDEFDQQGAHGDPYKVPPIQDEEPRDPILDAEASTSKTTQILPVHMPTALRTFGGFGFLRARGTPPIAGEGTDVESPMPAAVHDLEAGKAIDPSNNPRTQSPANTETQEPVITASTHALSVVQKDNLYLPSEMAPAVLPAGPGTDETTKALALSTVSAAPARIVAPAPPIEAVLLERKRLLVGTASRPSSPVGSGTSGTPVTPAAASARSSLAKVSRFKSSPLGVSENTSVSGVEKVNEGDRAGAGGREFEEKEDKDAKEEGRM